MITIVLTYRDRELRIAKNCLESLAYQTMMDFTVILVDYGSQEAFSTAIRELCDTYAFVKLLQCPVEDQLWNKSRAINIALKQCETPYFFMGDIDLIFSPHLIEKLVTLSKDDTTYYFQYGFLDKEESLKTKPFSEYHIAFKGELSGTTLFNTEQLLGINGYDEFYHGWGAEDADVLLRLKNNGNKVAFYDHETLMLHQWHPKSYRSKGSKAPFHSHLEQINHAYFHIAEVTKKTKANIGQEWGALPAKERYDALKLPTHHIQLVNIEHDIKGFCNSLQSFPHGDVVHARVEEGQESRMMKTKLKKILNRKTPAYIDMYLANDIILEEIIRNHRTSPYCYKFDQISKCIELTLMIGSKSASAE